jgi:hypothetical protein
MLQEAGLISYRYGKLTILSPEVWLKERASVTRSWKRNSTASSTNPGATTFGSPALNINNVLNRLDRTGFSFLLQDTEIALTLTRIARGAESDPDKRARNQTNARHAYDTVTELKSRVALTDDEEQELNQKLGQLKAELQLLGERF